MSERLRRFLIALATNEERTERFIKEALAESDLTDAEKAAVLSRDVDRVRRALGPFAAGPGVIKVVAWFQKKRLKKKRKVKRKTRKAGYSPRKPAKRASKKRPRRAAKSRRGR